MQVSDQRGGTDCSVSGDVDATDPSGSLGAPTTEGAGGVQLSPLVTAQLDTGFPVSFQVVKGGSKRGKDKLVSSDGFLFILKYGGSESNTWRCAERGRNLACSATVKQSGDNFIPGPHAHTHLGTAGRLEDTALRAKIKDAASIDKT